MVGGETGYLLMRGASQYIPMDKNSPPSAGADKNPKHNYIDGPKSGLASVKRPEVSTEPLLNDKHYDDLPKMKPPLKPGAEDDNDAWQNSADGSHDYKNDISDEQSNYLLPTKDRPPQSDYLLPSKDQPPQSDYLLPTKNRPPMSTMPVNGGGTGDYV